jgi:hypothetical protein
MDRRATLAGSLALNLFNFATEPSPSGIYISSASILEAGASLGQREKTASKATSPRRVQKSSRDG